MMPSFADLALNIMVAVLLVVTIAYCWVLNRRIKILQDSRSELAQFLKHFDESTKRASESIIALQTASKKIGENIQFRIDKANYLIDDLTFMIDKGNKLANEMEAGLAVGRARTKVMSEDAPPAAASQAVTPEAPHAEDPMTFRPEKPMSSRDKTAASLEAVLERVVGRSKAEPEFEPEVRSAPARPQPPKPRSRAEQELLDLIKAGIKG